MDMVQSLSLETVITSQRVPRMRPMTGFAKQSILTREERLDCFVAALLAMTMIGFGASEGYLRNLQIVPSASIGQCIHHVRFRSHSHRVRLADGGLRQGCP